VKLFLDSANLDHVREISAWGVLAGVTTNPSLIAKEGGDFLETIHTICEIVKGPVSAEVVAQDVDGMVREGRLLAQVHEHVVVKVPLIPAGLAATRVLADDGIPVNVTLCFQANQALLAGLAGAAYVSPFLGRLDDIGQDGMSLIEEIADVYQNDAGIGTRILAASIRHPVHVTQAARAGAHVATIPYAVFRTLLSHPLTDSGNKKFLEDWAKVPDRDIVGQVERWLARRA
jgi:transaldolase